MVVLIGFDGAGKSTVMAGLRHAGYPCTQFLDLFGPTARSERPRFHYADLESEPPELRTRTFLNLAELWLNESIEPLRNYSCFVVDSYIYRYAARERIWNPTCATTIRPSELSFPRPGLAIHLAVPVSIAYERKAPGHRSDYWPAMPRSIESFSKLQESVLADTMSTLYDLAIPVATVDAGQEPSVVLTLTVKLLESHRKRALNA